MQGFSEISAKPFSILKGFKVLLVLLYARVLRMLFHLLLYARVLRKLFALTAMRKGFEDFAQMLLLYARVLRDF